MRCRTCLALLVLSTTTFAQDFPAPAPRVADTPESLAVADLDADGRPDFLTTSPGWFETSNLAVTLATDGGWAQPVIHDIEKGAVDVAVGALDGDGELDVAVAHFLWPNFTVLRGAGGGALGFVSSYFVGGAQFALRLGDLDGDTHTDVVTFVYDGTVHVSRADGTGGFLGALAFPASPQGSFAGELELGDLDLDGDLDVVAAPAQEGTVSVLLGDGLGNLGPPALHAVAGEVEDLCVADATGEGALDVLVAHRFGNVASESLTLFVGNGAGGLAPAVPLEAGGEAVAVDVADMDADGTADVVGSVWGLFPETWAPDGVIVRHGLGAGAFAAPEAYRSQSTPYALAAADIDGDGALDAATLQLAGYTVGILRGDGSGGLQAPSFYGVEQPRSLDLAFMDGDDQLDLVVAGGAADVVNVLRGDGAGGFLAPEPYAASSDVNDATVGDFDGDAVNDVLAVGQDFVLLLGDGQGGLLAPLGLPPAPTTYSDLSAQAADLDGDGDLDGVGTFGGINDGLLVALEGDGAGGLVWGATAKTGGYPFEVAVGDLDGDGDPDAVTSNWNSKNITIVLGDGAGGLGPGKHHFAEYRPTAVALADFDLDGALDIVAAHEKDAALKVWPGNGLGGVEAGTVYVGSGEGRGVAAGDLDGDGAPDVAVSERLQRVAVWAGDGAGGLLPPQRWTAGTNSWSVLIRDLDGDARPEVLVANSPNWAGAGSISVLRNGTTPFVWAGLGFALAGAKGEPVLLGEGELLPGTPGTLALHHARPLSLAVLFVGAQAQPLPFKGGMLVPVPAAAQFVVITDALGSISLAWAAWPLSSPGEDWYFQYGIADPAAVHGVALSNALRATEP